MSGFVRSDGLEKVTGQGRYTADLALAGMLQGRFLLAGRAHARIRRIDTEKARRQPGVLAVITMDDVPQLRYGSAVKDRTLFARDIVRFEGEVVAAVAALTAEAAEAAIELIEVDYEPLPPVTDPQAALKPDGPLVHQEWQAYTAADGLVRSRNDCARVTIVKGDIEAGFKEADEIVEERYACDMSHPVPIEPHAVVAQWQGEKVTIWTTSQVPFAARAGVAETLAMPESNVRIVVPHLGGGFGGKCEFHFEAHVAALAKKAGRPVRVVFNRHDEFVAPDKVNHPMTVELRTGIKRDGTITARRARIVLDTGAYASDAPSIAEIATMMAAGPYRIPNLDIEAHTVYTNKTPAGSVRAPSGPQVAWAVEQHTDELGKKVGLDGYQVRARNLLKDGDEGPTGQRMTATGVLACLEKAVEMIGYGKPNPENEGVGLACGWWFSLPGASTVYMKMNADGSATIVTGAQENGSGSVMGLALIASEELGISPEKISLLYQDTDAGAWDMGSSGSQTTYNNGRAVIAASAEIRQRLLHLAAERLESAVEDLEIHDGRINVRGVPAQAVAVADIVAAAMGNGELVTARGAPEAPAMPENFGASCAGRLVFPAFADPTFVCQAVRVRVNPLTGVAQVAEVAAAHDFGHVINPAGAVGQVEGGIVHSIGMALSEGTQYRDGRQLNPHLLDYKLQTPADAPSIRIEFIETHGVGGPRGGKGVGEPPIIVAAAAVGNAIADAIGVRVRQLPMTPPRVWAARLEEGRR
ncbi:MAG TPA: xanthine dehydrogenase family protein molybdopterin-binding subunit [Candidatus Baltobacterales bacterium]|nr:xanthine dehydrogenase family protein molybdopterin-binding subunit [Candidatus Baltobacterales bacterium]